MCTVPYKSRNGADHYPRAPLLSNPRATEGAEREEMRRHVIG